MDKMLYTFFLQPHLFARRERGGRGGRRKSKSSWKVFGAGEWRCNKFGGGKISISQLVLWGNWAMVKSFVVTTEAWKRRKSVYETVKCTSIFHWTKEWELANLRNEPNFLMWSWWMKFYDHGRAFQTTNIREDGSWTGIITHYWHHISVKVVKSFIISQLESHSVLFISQEAI